MQTNNCRYCRIQAQKQIRDVNGISSPLPDILSRHVIFVCDRYHGAFPRRTDVHLEPRALGHTCCKQARTTSYRAPLSSVRHGHPAAGHFCAPLSGPGLRRTRHELQGAIAQVRGAISPAPDSAGVALIRPPTEGMAAWCSSEKIVSDGTIAKHHSTRGSRVIPQRSTSLAQPCLTSEIGRDRVCSEWYDRGMQTIPSPPLYRLHGSPPSTENQSRPGLRAAPSHGSTGRSTRLRTSVYKRDAQYLSRPDHLLGWRIND